MTSYNQLYLHCVWATWDRLPLITPDIEPQLYAALVAKCKELQCAPLAIGGISDHIHMLVRFAPTISVSRLIGGMKGSSSHAMTHAAIPGTFFKWQGTYGAFTISKRSVPQVRAYILNQKAHHADQTILPELERYLNIHDAS
jgi:REP element-mobilizing transposase RayT